QRTRAAAPWFRTIEHGRRTRAHEAGSTLDSAQGSETIMPLDTTIAPGTVLHTDSARFGTEVLESDVPVLVDFWAPWCGPCRALAPPLDPLAPRFAGKVKIVKINADDEPDLSARYGVRGLPTLLVFKDGKVVDTQLGNPGSLKPLEQLIQRNL